MVAATACGIGGGVISFAGLDSAAGTIVGSPAFITLDSDRSTFTSSDSTGTVKWIANGAPSNYEAQATVTSGSLSSGVTTWTSLSSDLTWQKNTGSCTFTLDIRDKWTTSTVKSVVVELQA